MKVLLVGVYRNDVPTNWGPIAAEIADARLEADQAWFEAKAPKFTMLNAILKEFSLREYDYLIVADDDIELPLGFLDGYVGLVESFDLALAQPARTPDSSISHEITRQARPPAVARLTRFVEIGPLFSIRRDLYSTLLPFDETSPMGWGYDLAWPVSVAAKGLRMGIVDCVPVRHALRPQIGYPTGPVQEQMNAYLEKTPHLSPEEAFVSEPVVRHV